MKHKKILIFILLLKLTFSSFAQDKNWHWSLEYAYGIATPLFQESNMNLQEKMKSTSSSGPGQHAIIGIDYNQKDKWTLRLGAGYKSLSYNNDSLGIDAVTMVSTKINGLEIPFLIQYPFSQKGWFVGVGGLYFIGFQDKTSYQLLNNNQRQQFRENSNFKGLGYQMQLGKQFKPDEKHTLNLRCIGQYYPNLSRNTANTFGFWNLALGLGITL
jgi:hypothetical protein